MSIDIRKAGRVRSSGFRAFQRASAVAGVSRGPGEQSVLAAAPDYARAINSSIRLAPLGEDPV